MEGIGHNVLVRFVGLGESTQARLRSLLPVGTVEAEAGVPAGPQAPNSMVFVGSTNRPGPGQVHNAAGSSSRLIAVLDHETPETCRDALVAGAEDWLSLDWDDAILALRMELLGTRGTAPAAPVSTPNRMHVLSTQTAGDGLVLRSVCRALDAEQGFLAEVSDAGTDGPAIRIMENLGWVRNHEAVEGYSRYHAEFPLPAEWRDRLATGEAVTATWNAGGQDSQCRSTLLLPIIVERHLQGVLCFTDRRVTREWREEHRRLARTVAASVATVLQQEALKAAARQSHEDYHELFLNANDIVYTHDLTGRFTSVNRAGQILFGYTADEFSRMSIEDIVAPSDLSRVRKMIATKLGSGEVRTTYRVLCRARDGRELQVETSTRVLTRDGKQVGIHGIARDITERVEAERQLAWHAATVAESPYAIVGRDINGVIVSWNKAAQDLYGYTAEEAIGTTGDYLIPPGEPLGNIPAAIMESSRAGEPTSGEFRRKTKAGDIITVSLSISAVHDAQGNVIGGAGISRDITAERKAAEEIARLAAIIESSHGAIVSRDRAGRIVSWNGGAARLYGYSADEVMGRTMEFLEPEGTRGEMERIHQILLAGGRLEDHETVRITRDGRLLDVTLSLFPVRDETGEIRSVAGIDRDVTEQKRIQSALAESEERYRLVALAANEVVWDWDLKQKQVQWSESIAEVLGFPLQEVPTREDWWPEQIHPDDQDRIRTALQEAVKGAETQITFEYRLRRQDGSYACVRDRCCLVRDARGYVTRMVGAILDITEQREAEAARRESETTFREMFAASPQPTYVCGEDSGRLLEVNAAMVDQFGFDREELLAMSERDLCRGSEHERMRIAIMVAADSGKEIGPWRYQRSDGSELWLDIRSHRMTFHGVPARLVITTDVTERRAAEERLRHRLQDTQALYNFREALQSASSEEEMISAGLKAIQAVCHADRASLRMRTSASQLMFKGAIGLSEWYQRFIEGHPPLVGEKEPIPPLRIDDVEAWHEIPWLRDAFLEEGLRAVASFPMSIGSRSLAQMAVYRNTPVAFTREETALGESIASTMAYAIEQRRVEDALRESENRFRAVAESMASLVWVAAPADDRLIFINRAVQEFAGFEPTDDMAEQSLLRLVYEDDWAWLAEQRRRRAAGEDVPTRFELRATNAHGELRTLDVSVASITLAGEAAVLCTALDITQRKNAELEVRQSEERFRTLMRDLDVGVLIYGPHGEVTAANQAATSLLGFTEAELTGQSRRERNMRFVKEDGSEFPEAERPLTMAITSRVPVRGVVMGVTRPNQPTLWLLVSTEPELDAAGEVSQVVATFVDITERKKMDEALRLSEANYRAVVEGTTDAIFALDRGADGQFRGSFVNKRFTEMTSMTPEWIMGKTAAEMMPAQYAPQAVARYEEAVRAGKPIEYEESFEHKGRHYDLITSLTPLLNDAGECYRIVGTSRDVTERMAARAAASIAEARLNAVVESAPIVLWAVNQKGELTLLKGRGIPRLQKPRTRIGQNMMGNWPDNPIITDNIRRGLAGEAFSEIVHVGDVVLDTHVTPQRNADGEVTGVIGVSVDVTERRRAEEALSQAQKLESLGMLAGGIAHDFNNLLVGILGNAGLVQAELTPGSNASEIVHEIELAGQRAADLARQMLAYSGRGRFVIERVDVNQLVQEMGNLLRVSINKSAVLAYDFAAGLPSVEADATQLRQVVMNLVVNASDAIGDSGGVITLSTRAVHANRQLLSETFLSAELDEGDYVQIEVIDSGPGMDAETRARIFDPFFTTKFTGRGLGLAAVLGIVRGHKGAIRVESEPGLGTKFTLLLPAKSSPVVVRPPLPPVSNWVSKGTILIVDDEETVRQVTSRAVRLFGFEALMATDGEEGVELFRQHKDEIVCTVLDLTMPRMGGAEAFKRMHEIDPDARIIVTSGYSENETMERFGAKGQAIFMQKPFEVGTLREAIRRIIDGSTGDGGR